MTVHLKMDAPQPRKLDTTVQGLLETPVDRYEGALKVSGKAPYAAEVILPGMVTGVLVRAAIPKGRITGMNDAAVKAMPGVLGVFTGERFLRNPAQGMANKAPVQGATKVEYLGQPVALVVAESFEQARHAAQALKLDYAAEPAEVNPETASQVDKPEKSQLDQGDLEGALRDAAVTLDVVYTTAPHVAAAMEPHASIAAWEGEKLTLTGSYQMLKYNRNELADSVGIPPENVHLRAPYIGGGFGSKLGIAPEAVSAALAARELGRPVRVVMTRQNVFDIATRRTETRQRIRLGADAQGRLTALEHDDRVSNLPGESFSEPTQQSTHFLYGGANRRYIHEVARVNRTASGSVRAPGEAVGMLALESAMDELACKMDLDPIELRKRNIPDTHPETGQPYAARSLAESLDEGARRFGWSARKSVPGSVRQGEWLYGMGVSAAARVHFTTAAEARVRLLADGTAVVESDMTDIGTGTYTILGQIAGEMLGLPQDKVEVRLGDTDFPPGSGSGGSIGAASTGSAVYIACGELRSQIAARLGCTAEELTLKDGLATGSNLRKTLQELLDGTEITADGSYEPGEAAKSSSQASYGAHFAEVAVNSVTGETRVRRMLGVFAAGRILNPKTAASQCMGGMIWGIGAALTEEISHDPRDGHVVNRDLGEYHVPVNLDVPQVDVVFLEERDDSASPIQAKGIGELGICGAGAAVTNAIYNACGVRVRDYPATLDKVLAGLPG